MKSKGGTHFQKCFVLFGALYMMLILSGFPAIAWGGKSSSGKLTVYVVNYPLKYFAERIAGDHAKVVFPAPAEGDPAYWMPDTKTISEYQRADIILLNGAGYAKWVGKVSLPRSKVIKTSAAFKDQYIVMKEAVTHSHGPGGEHAHENVAFTTWLDLDLASKQAKAVAEALTRKRPALRNIFRKNYASLQNDLMGVDTEIKGIVARNPSQPLVVSHPVYDYLARRYGLDIRSVHWEPEERPSDEQWMELRNMLKAHPAKWMIWEGEPMNESVESLKSMGLESLVFDPCGNVPDQGDFLMVMRQNVENLKMAFQ